MIPGGTNSFRGELRRSFGHECSAVMEDRYADYHKRRIAPNPTLTGIDGL
jgi:hypothetical protein